MYEDENELMLKYYNYLLEIVEQAALPPDEQLEKLNGFAVADEIALDFCDIGMFYVNKLFECQWLDNEQLKMANEIVEMFDIMSDDEKLWSDKELEENNLWAECRKKCSVFLKTLK